MRSGSKSLRCSRMPAASSARRKHGQSGHGDRRRSLDRSGELSGVGLAGEDTAELVAGSDVELGEDLVHVVLDGPCAAPERTPRRGSEHVPVCAEPDPVTLTVQEREVATLAAAGLTNKQIGERLFLSHRTVGAHLYRVFPKLAISSRAALRDTLATLPAA